MIFQFFETYRYEREGLTASEIDKILLSGRSFALAPNLARGGVAIFPHTYLQVCATQIAACVVGALDSGADQVLALGVLHSLTDEFIQAREMEKAGANVSGNLLRGIHGPRMKRGPYWKSEYSLLSFVFLWKEEIKRRGIKAPKLRVRYPYLVNRDPASLAGIHELQALAKDSCLVATADFCHHGVAYGMQEREVRTGQDGLQYAKKAIKEHVDTLCTGNFAAYYRHCEKIKSDAYDVGTLLYYLREPKSARVLDVKLTDVAALYKGLPGPSWVAASLVELIKNS